MKKIVCIFIFHLIYFPFTRAQDFKIWYEQPAQRWEESVPLGNGLVGMMPSGDIQEESIILNEISMWSGSKEDANNYEAHKSVEEIQRLLKEGKNDLAEQLVNRNFVCSGQGSAHGQGKDAPYGCYQNFGFLNMLFQHGTDYRDYRRELDLKTAVAKTQFKIGSTEYTRTYFTSISDRVAVIHLEADQKKALSMALHFYRDEHVRDYTIRGDEIHISGRLPDGKGGSNNTFSGSIKVIRKGGNILNYDNQIIVKEADEITVLVALTTGYYGHEPKEYTKQVLQTAQQLTYNDLLKRHTEAYSSLFDRVGIELPNERSFASIPTDKRLALFYEQPERDNEFAALYYQYGRYLSIASTAPDVPNALPPNLQGLWAPQIQTPWNGDYHLNINAQMNHWGVETGNLSEYHIPFINLIKRIAKEGEKTAKAYYNAPGWVVYMMTNIWGYSAPGEQASWGASTASGWLCNHLWEHFQFSQDTAYLRDIYPILKGAARFYQTTMVTDPKSGWLVTSPSVSPENAFRMPNGKTAAVVMGPTIDHQIVRELYEAIRASDEILQLKDPFAAQISEDIKKLPPPVRISSSGTVMEWLEDYEEVEPQHRHVSHLYGLYPASFISPKDTPEWAEAAKKSLEKRGDGGTGWSRAWKILFWARLQDGNHALELIRQLLKPAYIPVGDEVKDGPGTYPNLFCAHPPFQIDGNFGGSAGIAEMLIQSHNDYIHLLPALPDAWKEGKVSGLKARGNYTVDIEWSDGIVTNYRIRGQTGKMVNVSVNGKEELFQVETGE